jgi:hypothetical protein
MPSYLTLRRFMKANGLDKRRRVTSRQIAPRTSSPIGRQNVHKEGGG